MFITKYAIIEGRKMRIIHVNPNIIKLIFQIINLPISQQSKPALAAKRSNTVSWINITDSSHHPLTREGSFKSHADLKIFKAYYS